MLHLGVVALLPIDDSPPRHTPGIARDNRPLAGWGHRSWNFGQRMCAGREGKGGRGWCRMLAGVATGVCRRLIRGPLARILHEEDC